MEKGKIPTREAKKAYMWTQLKTGSCPPQAPPILLEAPGSVKSRWRGRHDKKNWVKKQYAVKIVLVLFSRLFFKYQVRLQTLIE